MTGTVGSPRLTRRTIVQSAAWGLLTPLAPGLFPAAGAQSGTPAAATDEAPTFPPDIQLTLHEIVERRLAEQSAPGALVGIWYPDRGVWTHAAGIGDLETGAAVTLDDHFRIASNTKTMVATVVLQLVDEGLISLDDAIEQYVPGVPNGDVITLRQLLNMTSGVADFVAVPELAAEYTENPLIAVGPEQILEVIRASTPNFEPGAKVQYCNSNYVLLGLVIEAVTGQPAAVEVQRRIFEPLGMTGSSFPMTPWMPEPTMHGFTSAEIGDPLLDVTRSNPDFPWTSGAVISTLADMRSWTVALAEGTLLSPETQQARLETNPLVTTPFPVAYGLGILDYNGLLGHNGGILGYSSWALHEPESGASFFVIVNLGTEQGGFADGILRDLMLLFYPERFAALSATPTPA